MGFDSGSVFTRVSEAVGVWFVANGPPGVNKGRYLASGSHNGRPYWRNQDNVLFYSSEKKRWFISDELEDNGFTSVASTAFNPPTYAWTKGTELTMLTGLEVDVSGTYRSGKGVRRALSQIGSKLKWGEWDATLSGHTIHFEDGDKARFLDGVLTFDSGKKWKRCWREQTIIAIIKQ